MKTPSVKQTIDTPQLGHGIQSPIKAASKDMTRKIRRPEDEELNSDQEMVADEVILQAVSESGEATSSGPLQLSQAETAKAPARSDSVAGRIASAEVSEEAGLSALQWTGLALGGLALGGGAIAEAKRKNDDDADSAPVVAGPVVKSFTVTDSVASNGVTLGKSGEALTFVVTMSEAVTSTGTLTAHFSINGQDVTATAAAVSNATTITFTGAAVPGTGQGYIITLTSLEGSVIGVSNLPMNAPVANTVSYGGYMVDNTNPVITTVTLNAAENGTAVGSVAATDATAITWAIDGSGADDSKFSITAGGVLSFNAAKDFEAADDAGGTASDGTYVVKVIATDAAGNATSQSINVQLTNVNEAPTVANAIADQTFVVGGAVDSFVLPANAFADIDAGTTLTYSAKLADGSALPSWLTFDAATRTFSGNPTANGTTTVRVTASDGTLSVNDDFVITSVTAPIVQSFTVTDGSTATGGGLANTSTLGTSGEPLTFVVTLSEAVSSTLPLTAIFRINGQDVTATAPAVSNASTITFIGATVPGTGDGTAISLIDLTSTGPIMGNVSEQPMIAPTAGTVTYAGYTVDNTAPMITTVSMNTAENGTAVGSLVATDTNAITWSIDGSGADDSKFSITAGGVLTFNAAKNFEAADDAGGTANDGVYVVKVKAMDAAGNVSTQNISVTLTDVNEAPTVANAIADQTFVVGGAVDSFVLPANAFADVDAGAVLTYSAKLADGSALPSWLTFDAATRTFSGNPTANGTTTVRVTASDGTLSVDDDFVITSVTAPIVQSFTVTDGTASNGTTLGKSGEALTFVVTLSEGVTSSFPLTAQFIVNGQSVTATAAPVSNATTITFVGASVPGTGDGAIISLTSLASAGPIIGNVSAQPMITPTPGAVTYAGYTVDNTAPVISTVTMNTAENGTAVGTVVATDTGAVTWTIDGSGADDSKFSITSGGVLTLNAAKDFEVADDAGGVAYDGIYVVKVNATDAAGNVSSQSINVQLTNVNEAPTVANAIADQTFVVGGAVDSFVLPANAFADIDAGTTLTYSAKLADGSALPSWLTFDAATRTFTGNPTVNGTTTVRVTASDGNLSVDDSFVITAVEKPVLSSTLDGVTNFDVRSDIVLSSTENVTAVAGKYIHIINDGGAGYAGENTVHTQDILVTDTTQVTISNGKITINPLWDLDLANNYHITIDDGAFLGGLSGLASLAISDATSLNFSTVLPFAGTASSTISSAEASQMMNAGTDAMVASGAWFSAAGIGDTSTANAGATFDLSSGNYVILGGRDESIVPFDDNNSESGLSLTTTMWIQLNNFGLKDSIYIDDQYNNPAYPNKIEGDPSAVAEQTTTLSRIAVPASNGQGWFDVVLASEVAITKFNSINELATATNPLAVIVA